MLFQLSGYAAAMQEAMMAKTPVDDFLATCVIRDPEGTGLSLDELYGLYLSWCGLAGSTPVRYRIFRAGLRAAGIRPIHRDGWCPGLMMAGPAAFDYLVHRELPLAVLDAPGAAVPSSSAVLRGAARPGWPDGGARGSVPAA